MCIRDSFFFFCCCCWVKLLLLLLFPTSQNDVQGSLAVSSDCSQCTPCPVPVVQWLFSMSTLPCSCCPTTVLKGDLVMFLFTALTLAYHTRKCGKKRAPGNCPPRKPCWVIYMTRSCISSPCLHTAFASTDRPQLIQMARKKQERKLQDLHERGIPDRQWQNV